MRKVFANILLATIFAWTSLAATPALPGRPDSLKFAVIGDNGTGSQPQHDVARQMERFREVFPFDLAIMLGDNLYKGNSRSDLSRTFERPYARLLAAGVRFRAALGNHDPPDSRFYEPFNMNGERYYTYARKNVRFFVLDTNLLDDAQLRWLDEALSRAGEDWKICYFHHAVYSSAGRHGSAVDLRVRLEPLFVKHGVSVVFAGHDHVYERIKPQKGIHYFVVGSAGKLREGDLRRSNITAAGFDQDHAFMLAEIVGADMFFQAISRTGHTVDSGVIRRRPKRGETILKSPPSEGQRTAGGAAR